jgi:hypothetical protein
MRLVYPSAKVWQFRYNSKHLVPRLDCRQGVKSDCDYALLAAEQTDGLIQRLFVASAYDVSIYNIADEGRLISSKEDLHVRPIVAMLFIEQRNVLATAARDGSSEPFRCAKGRC